jgi:hypothetical protein
LSCQDGLKGLGLTGLSLPITGAELRLVKRGDIVFRERPIERLLRLFGSCADRGQLFATRNDANGTKSLKGNAKRFGND